MIGLRSINLFHVIFSALGIITVIPISLQWADCGTGRGSLIHFSNLHIQSARGTLEVGFDGMLETGLTGPPKINITVEKNLFGPWTPVPCINKIGSCIYDNPCDFVKTVFNVNDCPSVLRGYGCSGLSLYDPIPYFLNTTVFNLATASDGFKNYLTGSALRVQIEMIQEKDNQQKLVGCVSFFITLAIPCSGFLCGG